MMHLEDFYLWNEWEGVVAWRLANPHLSEPLLCLCSRWRRHHERGHGAQRGQPQHPGDEQQGHVAVLRPGHRAAARGPAQHPGGERARGLDPHQPHSQPGEAPNVGTALGCGGGRVQNEEKTSSAVSLQCMYLLLHTVKGTPFETPDQGKARLLTHWEQMDYGVQFTASRKFLTITPIVL